ncbi:MAG TPA: extracellular solute-binding protein, partial [Rhodospirillales bacterium]|nr:extracellular solute-binding protein [Rhodospirillales bacterium]
MKAVKMKTSKIKLSSKATLKAAKTFTRRTLLKSAVAAASAAAMGPWIVRDAFSSSGNLKIMMWSDYLPDSISQAFKDATGIHLSQSLYGSDEELLHRVKAFKGRGFDLICPTASHMAHWRALSLLQPWDMKRAPLDRMDQGMLEASLKAGTWGGKAHHLPFVWGTEGLAWRTDKWFREPADLTYGDLWSPQLKGKIMGAPNS